MTFAVCYTNGHLAENIVIFVTSQCFIIQLVLSKENDPSEELNDLSKYNDRLTHWLYRGTLPGRLYMKALGSLDETIRTRQYQRHQRELDQIMRRLSAEKSKNNDIPTENEQVTTNRTEQTAKNMH